MCHSNFTFILEILVGSTSSDSGRDRNLDWRKRAESDEITLLSKVGSFPIFSPRVAAQIKDHILLS